MPDNKDIRGPRDRARINIHEDYEVRYWTQALKISKEKLKEVVSKAGTSAAAVRRYLGKS